MKTIFKRHRVRATFYHTTAFLVVLTMIAVPMNWISADTGFIATVALFFIDYIAEMYDPHPDNPGPWFKAHFHRFLNDDGED